ncbi:MAG: A/G-specific adenine glycosylase [Candidatus Eiseniibacteriota bacterium]
MSGSRTRKGATDAAGAAADKRLRASILRWYTAHRRDLPWRRTRDPYAIWISEIMLQQTGVDTVVPYYERFLGRFPDTHSLAGAPEADVLAAWSGLGYYRRAKHLRDAAALLVREHAGRVPDDDDALRQLPGIGEYTAAAIASIAFGRAAAAVDGNVVRVIARIRGFRGERSSPALRRRVLERAKALASGPNPGDWTQALMELGATVCLPRNPQCDACPARTVCMAQRSGDPSRYPAPAAKAAPRRGKRVMLFARLRGRVLLVQDPTDGGAWTLPTATPKGRGARAAELLARRLGLPRPSQGPAARFRHRTFANDLEVEVWEVGPLKGRPEVAGVAGTWARPADLQRLPMRSPTLKAFNRLQVKE